jgi:putative FmdB family regulatory protein
MPVYTYRREDGTTFEFRQKFLDDPLEMCPTTGQRVVRIVQNAGVIFKGSGFYVNDSKDASKRNLSTTPKSTETSAPAADTPPVPETKSEKKAAPAAD